MPPKTRGQLGDSRGDDGGELSDGEGQSPAGLDIIMAAIASIQQQLEQQGAQLAQQSTQLAQQGWAVREDVAEAGAPEPGARATCRLPSCPLSYVVWGHESPQVCTHRPARLCLC